MRHLTKQNAFSKELAKETRVTGPQRPPHRELFIARYGASQGQAPEVGTGNEQHKADYNHQDLKWLAELLP